MFTRRQAGATTTADPATEHRDTVQERDTVEQRDTMQERDDRFTRDRGSPDAQTG